MTAVELTVMVYNLEEIVFAVFEDHVDGAVLQDCLNVPNHVWMRDLGTKTHFTDGGLRDACVQRFILSLGLESVRERRLARPAFSCSAEKSDSIL